MKYGIYVVYFEGNYCLNKRLVGGVHVMSIRGTSHGVAWIRKSVEWSLWNFFKDPEYHVLVDEKVMVSDINVAIGCDSAGEIDSNIYPSDTDPVI